MTLQLCEARVGAMRRLYALHRKGSQDSEYLDVLDTALNLALGEKRAVENAETLCRNLLRDARRTVNRSRARSRHAAAGRPLPDARRRRAVSCDDEGCQTVEMVDHDTPEELAVADELILSLRSFALGLGHYGAGCLEGLLRGETAAQTAKKTGVSVATVERARRALRLRAESVISADG